MDKEISVRGSINALEVNGTVEFDRASVKPSYVRYAAYVISVDTGRKFQVNLVQPATVRVTRTY